MRMNCILADVCLADYWGGHHLPHVQVPLYDGISFKEIREDILNELRQGAVMGSDDNARLLSADYVDDDNEKLADQLTRAAYAAVERDVRGRKKGARVYRDKNLPSKRAYLNDGDTDTVWGFFVFRRIDQ